ncbi:MAG TPA: 50S ribosomal protein L24 [Candidatus Nanoarchaeia archaeon]|nr:50S ribosomal protein L24 [Candidatus Nanoarchaeia archaeon]
MKKKFSVAWKGSSKPKKQVKYRHQAPLHIKHKMVSAHLSGELRKKYGKRSAPLRKGDKVKIMRGNYKKKDGKVLDVNLKRTKVFIEGFQVSKIDGTKSNIPFAPSNLMIVDLNLDDKERKKSIEVKQNAP